MASVGRPETWHHKAQRDLVLLAHLVGKTHANAFVSHGKVTVWDAIKTMLKENGGGDRTKGSIRRVQTPVMKSYWSRLNTDVERDFDKIIQACTAEIDQAIENFRIDEPQLKGAVADPSQDIAGANEAEAVVDQSIAAVDQSEANPNAAAAHGKIVIVIPSLNLSARNLFECSMKFVPRNEDAREEPACQCHSLPDRSWEVSIQVGAGPEAMMKHLRDTAHEAVAKVQHDAVEVDESPEHSQDVVVAQSRGDEGNEEQNDNDTGVRLLSAPKQVDLKGLVPIFDKSGTKICAFVAVDHASHESDAQHFGKDDLISAIQNYWQAPNPVAAQVVASDSKFLQRVLTPKSSLKPSLRYSRKRARKASPEPSPLPDAPISTEAGDIIQTDGLMDAADYIPENELNFFNSIVGYPTEDGTGHTDEPIFDEDCLGGPQHGGGSGCDFGQDEV